MLRLVLPSSPGRGRLVRDCMVATTWNVMVGRAAMGCVRETVDSLWTMALLSWLVIRSLEIATMVHVLLRCPTVVISTLSVNWAPLSWGVFVINAMLLRLLILTTLF